jgi:hypothetical protein
MCPVRSILPKHMRARIVIPVCMTLFWSVPSSLWATTLTFNFGGLCICGVPGVYGDHVADASTLAGIGSVLEGVG